MLSRRSAERSSSRSVAPFLPPIQISPPSACSSSPAIWSSVDLPQPEGPTSATSSPRRTASDTPRSTSSLAAPCSKLRLTPLRTRTLSLRSLIAQGLHRIEPRRPPGRIEGRGEGKREGHRHDERYLTELDDGRQSRQEVDDARQRYIVFDAGEPAADALDAAGDGQAESHAEDRAEYAGAGAAHEEDAENGGARGAHGAEDRDLAPLVLHQHHLPRHDVERGHQHDQRQQDEGHDALHFQRRDEGGVEILPI